MRCARPVLGSALTLLMMIGASRPACFGQGPAAQSQPAATGSLRVKTDITGVQILLDGQAVGTTPMTIRSVSVGAHELALVRDGYEAHQQAVTVNADKTELVVVAMKPMVLPLPELPVTFRAVHQHIAGYCIGTLMVTADSIEYTDDTKKDVFRILIRSLRSVSRSFGASAGIAPVARTGPMSAMACRLEAPDRSYCFWAVKVGLSDDMEVVSGQTSALFRVVYRLWSDTLKKPSQ